MIKGWTGKRLRIDLGFQKAWVEDIALADLRQWFGGRGLNASFFVQHFPSPISPASPENPVAFAAGPLTGTLAPASGWTSIASISPILDPPRYGITRMAGHFGASLKGAGFDQCIIQGRANRPVYLWIDGEEVKFEKADHLWGKETTGSSVAIQEEKADRSVEVLCIGPAGERRLPFANAIHRLSWTGDHLGLGYLFGVKQLKAIAIRGKKPITLHDPQRFLNLCLGLKDRIQKDRKIRRLRESGAFSLLEREGGVMMKQGTGRLPFGSEKQWAISLRTHVSGRQSCFSCPVHCGVNIEYQGGYFGGIHPEKAWHWGPRIGVYNGEWTLKLLRFCQTRGLDPFLAGSLLTRILEGVETGPLSEEDLRQADGIEDQGEKAFFILHRLIDSSRKEFDLVASRCPENEDLDVLADILSFCLVVVNRLNLMTVSNMIDLVHAATGYALSKKELRDTIWNILQMESRLQNKQLHPTDESPLPHFGEGQISEILRKEEHHNESIIHGTAS